jgi:hypothetical protein
LEKKYNAIVENHDAISNATDATDADDGGW